MSNLPPPMPSSGEPPAWNEPSPGLSVPPPPPGFSNDAGAAGSRNGVGTASLVLGILSIVTGLFGIGIVLGIIGLILGFVGRSRVKRGEASNGGAALGGVITSIIGSLISIAVIVFAVVILSSGSFGSLTDCLDDARNDKDAIDQCERDFQDDLFGG